MCGGQLTQPDAFTQGRRISPITMIATSQPRIAVKKEYRTMQKRATAEEAFKRKYPEQVVIVTTRSRDGKPNAMAVGWVAIASSEPWMFVLGIDGEAHTLKLIRSTREFVVAYPNERMGRETLHVGTRHGGNCNKLKDCGLVLQKGKIVRAPLLADAVANFECKLVRIVTPGDCPLVIGKVVAAHVNRDKAPRRLCTVAPGYALKGVRAVRR